MVLCRTGEPREGTGGDARSASDRVPSAGTGSILPCSVLYAEQPQAATSQAEPECEPTGEDIDFSDCFLQLLPGAESDLPAGLDLNGFAGSWIAAHPRCTMAYLQDAEAGEAKPLALRQVAGRECDEIGEHHLALLLGKIVPLREFGSHLLQRDGYCRPRL